MLRLLLPALVLALNLCLIVPFQLFSGNRFEFDVGFVHALPFLGPAFVLVALLLGIPGLALKGGARENYRLVLFALALAAWIQATFLRWNYGLFDGRGVDWQSVGGKGWIDLAVWVACVATVVLFRRHIQRQVTFLSLALALLPLLASVARVVGDSSLIEGEDRPPSLVAGIADVSKRSNCFHVILDGFQTDVLLELVEEEQLGELLPGFVVFEENLSVAGWTTLSVPAILGAHLYDGTVAVSDYFSRNVVSRGLPRQLHRLGYVVNLMPYLSMKKAPHTNHQVVPKSYQSSDTERGKSAAAYLLDVSLFRHVPHALKRPVYNDANWQISRALGTPAGHTSFHQKAFFRDYTQALKPAYDRPAYHFIHLSPPHPPFVTRADGSYAGKTLPNTRENYKHEARHVLRLFVEFLERLRQLKLYESSVVVLQGDHGASVPLLRDGQEVVLPVQRAAALMAIKPRGSRQPFRVSSAPASAADTPRTICDLLGLETNYPGTSVFDLPEQDLSRPRRFVMHDIEDPMATSVITYVVRGSIYDSASWSVESTTSREKGVARYEWGESVSFGVGGRADRYLGRGWSLPTSARLQWSDATEAEFRFEAPAPSGDVRFEFTLYPYVVPGKLDRQRIAVEMDRRTVFQGVATSVDPVTFEFVVEQAFVPATVRLVFHLPDATVPREIGEGGEARRLGVALYRFSAHVVER